MCDNRAIYLRGKNFVSKNFRHLTKISSLFADEVFTDKVPPSFIQLQSGTKYISTTTKNGVVLVATSNVKLFLETIW